ncbi:hypothetical protein V5799_013869 [Amblyomma americanum]|uniref:Reelin domain-containing protein n=1 Tax=Amblyomma americanum TaxID=6943 RepID=A0AAQ4E4N1_AMBAM
MRFKHFVSTSSMVPFQAVILHKDYSTKTRAAVVWRPPRGFSGTIVFRAAVVRKIGEQPQHIVSVPVNVEKAKTFIWSRPALRNSVVARARVSRRSAPATASSFTNRSVNDDGPVKAMADGDAKAGGAAGGKTVYKECGVSTGCFGYPPGCIATSNCLMLVSYQLQDDGYHFDLISGPMTKDKFWIAAGVSDSDKMVSL